MTIEQDLSYERARYEARLFSKTCKNVDDLVRHLKVSLYESPISPLDATLSKESHENPQVVVNSHLGKEKRLFTLAHMMGHVIERAFVSYKQDYHFVDMNDGTYNLHEFFADEFAYEFLLPTSLMVYSLEQGISFDKLAETQGVSLSIVKAWVGRLKKTGDLGDSFSELDIFKSF